MELSKCVFSLDQMDYLGCVILVGGVAPDLVNVKAMLDWPPPQAFTALRGFLGFVIFYRSFMRNYATISTPLTDLLRYTKFTCSIVINTIFTELDHKMTDMSVLDLPNFTKTFTMEIDASGVAIGDLKLFVF